MEKELINSDKNCNFVFENSDKQSKLPTYEETMLAKEKEESEKDQKTPYVKFPHGVNKGNKEINTQFPGNKTLTYLNVQQNRN
ncbi:hypothetical protein QEN19_000886 [Hanseniaspora menglaensis]